MTPEELQKLNDGIEAFERLAARLEAATRTFREARELLGGTVVVQSPAQPVTQSPPSQLRPDELARRQMLLDQFPKEIQEAERRG